jgi:hypothetical protein
VKRSTPAGNMFLAGGNQLSKLELAREIRHRYSRGNEVMEGS